MRKKYLGRFILRVLVLGVCVGLYFGMPDCFDVLDGYQFFKGFSILHLLWAVWMLDMILKFFPTKGILALGALKHLRGKYVPSQKACSQEKLIHYTKESNRKAFYILVVWCLLGLAIGIFAKIGVLKSVELFLISVLFYVCDLICVLFWCPFRVWFMKNRCCTTCRIFNWDHMMMFTPMIFVKGFYGISLVVCGVFVMLVWEIRVRRTPERFYELTNDSLKCKKCTDRLCGKKF